jgi:hypothetical protein
VITFGDMCVDLIVTGTGVMPRFGQMENKARPGGRYRLAGLIRQDK